MVTQSDRINKVDLHTLHQQWHCVMLTTVPEVLDHPCAAAWQPGRESCCPADSNTTTATRFGPIRELPTRKGTASGSTNQPARLHITELNERLHDSLVGCHAAAAVGLCVHPQPLSARELQQAEGPAKHCCLARWPPLQPLLLCSISRHHSCLCCCCCSSSFFADTTGGVYAHQSCCRP